MQKKPEINAIYLRKSRKDLELEALGEGETLARHRAALLELAEKQGLTIGKIYEEVVSGESIAARPQVQLLLDDVMSGMYAGVLVMEVERLARGNTKDQGVVAEAFSLSGTLIITPAKTYDPTNEFDEEYFEFGLFMSRREYKTIRRRMERGRVASMQEGNYVGSIPPYGYDAVRVNKKERILVPNEAAQHVRQIYDWFVREGVSSGEIARRLTRMGIPTMTGRREWNGATVKDILRNVHYTGRVCWNRRKTSREYDEDRTVRRMRRLTPEDYAIYPGKHEAIIDNETFEAAQNRFGSAPVKAGTLQQNPLTGLLYCAQCGKALTYKTFPSRQNTRARYSHNTAYCSMKSGFADEVVSAVADALYSYVADFRFKLDSGEEKRLAEQHAAALRTMEAELAKLVRKREQIFDLFEDGTYSKVDFQERKRANEARLSEARAALEEYRSSAPPVVDYAEKIVRFTEAAEALKDDAVPAREKNKLLKAIVWRIELETIDRGRQHGADYKLRVYLKA